jgi:hypothetical protein
MTRSWWRPAVYLAAWMALWAPQVAAQSNLLPGDTRVDASRLTNGTWVRHYVRVQDGKEQPVGRVEFVLEPAGAGQLRFVQRFENSRGTMVDTSVFRTAGMQPLRHRGHSAQRVLTLDFDGLKVSGHHAPAEGAAHDISADLDGPVFDSSVMELLLGALPLARDLRGRLPVYLYEGGLVWLSFQVVDFDATEGAWEVDARMQDTMIHFRIEDATRRVLETAAALPDGSEMRMVR